MLYDGYQRFHETALSAQEQSLLDSAQASPTLSASTVGHMDIAKARANAQFETVGVIPEDETMSIRFPGLDPVGKYCVMDMKFAQQEKWIQGALMGRSDSGRAYFDYFQTQVKASPKGKALTQDVVETCCEHRLLTRAAKLCLDPEGAQALHLQARALEEKPCIQEYSKMLEGLETLAGQKSRQQDAQTTNRYFQDHFDMSIDLTRAEAMSGAWVAPSTININFPNFDNQLFQGEFARPQNWGKTATQLKEDYQPQEHLVSNAIPPYVSETVGLTLEPFFEKLRNTALPFGSLLIVDGMSVTERMAKDGLDTKDNDLVQSTANHYVAEALMTGRRVEAFAMDDKMRITREPIAITKTGFEPSPLEPVKLNAWQRYFNRHGGHFAEKAQKAKEYEDTMAARERVREMVGPRRLAEPIGVGVTVHQAQLRAMETQALPRIHNIEQTMGSAKRTYIDLGKQFFPNGALEKTEENTIFRTGRTAEVSFCLGMLAHQGHSVEDMLDPTKLQGEKAAMAAHFVDLRDTDNQLQYTQEMYQGMQALNGQLDTLLKGVNVADEKALLQAMPELECISHAGFDLGQELGQTVPRALMAQQDPPVNTRTAVDEGLRMSVPLTIIQQGYQAETALSATGGRYSSSDALATELGKAALGNALRSSWAEEISKTGRTDTLNYEAVSMGNMLSETNPGLQDLSERLWKNPDALDATRLCILQGRTETALNIHMDFTKDANTFLAEARIEATSAKAKPAAEKAPAQPERKLIAMESLRKDEGKGKKGPQNPAPGSRRK